MRDRILFIVAAVGVQAMPTAQGSAPAVEWKKAGPNAISLPVTESPVYVAMTKGS